MSSDTVEFTGDNPTSEVKDDFSKEIGKAIDAGIARTCAGPRAVAPASCQDLTLGASGGSSEFPGRRGDKARYTARMHAWTRRIATTSILAALIPALSCKAREAGPSPAASASAAATVAPPSPQAKVAPRPVIGTDVKVVRCDLPAVVPEGGIRPDQNSVAATRHLHLGPDRSLYFFPDFSPPVRLEPIDGGCGYRLAPPVELEKEHHLGLNPDGSFSPYAFADETPMTKCRVRAFDELRYGHGTLVGGRFFHREADTRLEVMDLADPACESKEASLPELPRETGAIPWLGVAGDQLLVSMARADWSHEREVFRYDAAGTLLRRYGAPTGKAVISSDVHGCGDGFCVEKGHSSLAIHDREGELVRSYSLTDQVKLESILVAGIVDVPGKGVYVLIGYHVPTGKGRGRAELVRLDGVY